MSENLKLVEEWDKIGTPRYMASPDINTEDFQAAVDFLLMQGNLKIICSYVIIFL